MKNLSLSASFARSGTQSSNETKIFTWDKSPSVTPKKETCLLSIYSTKWLSSKHTSFSSLFLIYRITYRLKDDYCKNIYYGAAQSGNLSLFESLKSQGYPFNRKACQIAAENGHLDLIEWILSEIQIWTRHSSTETVYNEWISAIIGPAAAKNGHLHILKSMPSDINWEKTIESALEYGQIHILKWLREKEYLNDDDDDESWVLYAGSNLNSLLWLNQEFPNEKDSNLDLAMSFAVKSGNLEAAKYLLERNASFESFVVAVAVENGHFEMLQWLHENQCEWDETITSLAAKSGNLKILQWLIEKNCPIDCNNLGEKAIKGGNLQLIKWIQSNLNIQFANTKYVRLAIEESHWNVLEWLLQNECIVDDIKFLVDAIRKRASLPILKKLFLELMSNHKFVCETAGKYGRYDFIKWIIQEIDDENIAYISAYTGASEDSQLELMKKIYSKYCICTETIGFRFYDQHKWLQKQECLQKK